VILLVDQYRELERKTKRFEKGERESKRSEKKLIRMIERSNRKIENFEDVIERLLCDIKERDYRIEEFEVERKNVNMRMMEENGAGECG
jgi:predicted RNase H-like nuclease (RuvC/YqgF family)